MRVLDSASGAFEITRARCAWCKRCQYEANEAIDREAEAVDEFTVDEHIDLQG